MGDLDDAIREHLELKRRHGASEEEVTTKEREAQRQGALPRDPGASYDEAPEPVDEPVAEEPAEATAPEVPAAVSENAELETSEEVTVSPPEPPPFLTEDPEPDEVLPEEALELEAPEDQSENVLEETPEFLEDMPEQDRLWFEQRPPKDFDFDD
jgi:hypothetical protein